MSAQHKRLQTLYEAFNARNIELALSGMHPDVDWANGMEGGIVHGRSGVRDYWTRQWQLIDPRVYPQSFEGDAAEIVVEVHQVVRATWKARLNRINLSAASFYLRMNSSKSSRSSTS